MIKHHPFAPNCSLLASAHQLVCVSQRLARTSPNTKRTGKPTDYRGVDRFTTHQSGRKITQINVPVKQNCRFYSV